MDEVAILDLGEVTCKEVGPLLLMSDDLRRLCIKFGVCEALSVLEMVREAGFKRCWWYNTSLCRHSCINTLDVNTKILSKIESILSSLLVY